MIALRWTRIEGFVKRSRLLENLGLARGDGRYARMLKSLARVQVLILDEWGITPLTADQRRDLLEIVDDRHGRASTVVTSQLPVAHWHEHIGNPTIARCRARPPCPHRAPYRTQGRIIA